MIFNNQELFSDKQAITATADSTNVIDIGVPGTPYDARGPLNYDIGKGTMIPLTVTVTEDFNNLTTLEISVQTGSTTGLGTEVASQTIALADLRAGALFNLVTLPIGVEERYLGIVYTVAGTAPTTGRVTAGITMGTQTNFTGA